MSKKKEEAQNVYTLPDPSQNEEIEVNLKAIEELNSNLAEKVRSSQSDDMEIIKSLNVDDQLQAHALLKLHVNRWKVARKEWARFYKDTNSRYKDSEDLLKAIYEEFE